MSPYVAAYGPRFLLSMLVLGSVSALTSLPSLASPPIDVFPDNEIPLSKFHFRQEAELLKELGITPDSRYESRIADLTNWVLLPPSSGERQRLAAECEAAFANLRVLPPTSPLGLACIPWQIERMAVWRASPRPIPTKRVRTTTVFTQTDWDALRGKAFTFVYERTVPRDLAYLQRLGEFAETTEKDCEFRGAATALVIQLDNYLAEPEAAQLTEKIYPQLANCLRPEDDGYEYVHYRVGLGRHLRGKDAEAKEALERALLARDPKEHSRVLYWLGSLFEQEKGESAEENPYWVRLRRYDPIGFHSIMATQRMGEDPLNVLLPGDQVFLARRTSARGALGRVRSGAPFDGAALVFELFIARKNTEALRAWSRFVARFVPSPSHRTSLFLAMCHDAAQNYHSSISLLGQYHRQSLREEGGIRLSQEVLELMFPRPFADLILTESASVDPVLLFALIRQESAFDPYARSVKDARGLMQVLPSTARRAMRGRTVDLYEPTDNVIAGVSYLKALLKRHGGRVEHALAAYNAGGVHLNRWKGRYLTSKIQLFSDLIPYRETRNYISIILRNAYWYGRLMTLQNDATAKRIQQLSQNARWKSDAVGKLLQVAWSQELKSRSTAPNLAASAPNQVRNQDLSAFVNVVDESIGPEGIESDEAAMSEAIASISTHPAATHQGTVMGTVVGAGVQLPSYTELDSSPSSAAKTEIAARDKLSPRIPKQTPVRSQMREAARTLFSSETLRESKALEQKDVRELEFLEMNP